MRNNDILIKKLDDALDYLYNQEQTLSPIISYLEKIIKDKIKECDLSAKDALDIYFKIQEQYTNSILLITKIQEIINFKD